MHGLVVKFIFFQSFLIMLHKDAKFVGMQILTGCNHVMPYENPDKSQGQWINTAPTLASSVRSPRCSPPRAATLFPTSPDSFVSISNGAAVLLAAAPHSSAAAVARSLPAALLPVVAHRRTSSSGSTTSPPRPMPRGKGTRKPSSSWLMKPRS